MKLPGLTTVRRMQLGDVREVEAIDRLSFPSPWPAGAFIFELTENTRAQCWVTETEGRVSGALVGWLVLDEYQIGTIAVHPDYRRRGVGRALLRRALEEAQQAGARTAVLEVRVGNQSAQSLYRQFGFRIVGDRPRFYADGEDAYTMTVELLRAAADSHQDLSENSTIS